MSKDLNSWRKWNKDGYQKCIANRKMLHDNSQEVVSVLKEFNVLDEGAMVLEVGCGCGRNLAYILEAFPTVHPMGNDLVKSQCFKYMDKNLKEEIDFFEIDTQSFFREYCLYADLMLVSDHFMHLDDPTYLEVAEHICTTWRPSYLMIRDGHQARKTNPPKYIHDFYTFKSDYDLLYEAASAASPGHTVYLYKLKEPSIGEG